MTADPRHDYLAAYRRSVESSTEVRDANLQAVLERSGRVGADAATGTRWAASALIIKFTTVALVTTGLGWGVVAVLSDDAPSPAPTVVAAAVPAPAPAPNPHPAAQKAAAAPATVPVAVVPAPEPVTATPAAAAVRVQGRTQPEPQAADDRLREELALLGDAQQHLRDGRIAEANSALREHARRFPQGTLSVERSAWRAIAACSGSGPQPKAAARSFILTQEDTPLSAKVKSECGL